VTTPDASLPDAPEPLQVELELTNRCNANCSACPRDDMPTTGRLEQQTLDRILEGYLEARDGYRINQRLGGARFPKVTVAGGGDPLIHPKAIELLARCVELGFETHLITNAAALTPARTAALVESGVRSIAVSFWGIEEGEYERAMRLPYERTLRKVERLATAASAAGIDLCVLWVRTPEIVSSRDAIQRFWSARGIEVDMSDNHAWNRGGLVPMPRQRVAPEVRGRPDFERRIWCSDLFFSDTYRWNGDCVLCCCNYFAGRPITLGNVATLAPDEVSRRKAELLDPASAPAMCRVCELPRRLRSEWLAGPWLPLIGEDERRMVLYEGAAT
jgi:hypothetical protein